jgi:restriction system protein
VARRKKQSSGGLGALVVGVLVLWYFLDSASGGNGLLALFVLVGLAVAAVWLVRRLSGTKTATASELAQRLAAVGLMSGAQFERFTADVFAAMGHKVTLLGGSGDQGVDLIVDYQGQRVAVQCKNYKKRVGNKPVQEVYAGARHHRCSQAWVVAPAGYTKGAHDLARSTGVRLFDAGSLKTWIGKVDGSEKERERRNKPTAPISSSASGNDAKDNEIREYRKRVFWHPHPDDLPASDR